MLWGRFLLCFINYLDIQTGQRYFGNFDAPRLNHNSDHPKEIHLKLILWLQRGLISIKIRMEPI